MTNFDQLLAARRDGNPIELDLHRASGSSDYTEADRAMERARAANERREFVADCPALGLNCGVSLDEARVLLREGAWCTSEVERLVKSS